MKQFLITGLMAIMLIAAGGMAMASNCHDEPKGHDMSASDDAHKGHDMKMDGDKHKGHDGMAAKGVMMMLDNATVDGVTGMPHVKDVSAAMAKMGMKITHHIMVKLVDEKTGEPIEAGSAAVKVKGPDGEISAPFKMMLMSGQFGADVVLAEKGVNTFIMGTKLPDGKKRTFEFSFKYE